MSSNNIFHFYIWLVNASPTQHWQYRALWKCMYSIYEYMNEYFQKQYKGRIENNGSNIYFSQFKQLN